MYLFSLCFSFRFFFSFAWHRYHDTLMDWLLINSKAPKTDIILAMHAVLVRHHEAETNIYGCNMYIIGGIKKFNRVPVTPFLSLLSKHWSWRGLHFVITIVRDLLVFFFFFSAYPFSFLSFSGRKCNKKNLHWREETWQSWTEFAHFSWCMLPKKKKHLPRDYSKTLQVVTFSLYLMVLKKFQHQVQRVHLPRKTY